MADTPRIADPSILSILILTELRSSLYLLGATINELSPSSSGNSDQLKALRLEQELLLTQMDDALEICSPQRPEPKQKRALHLSQVAEDFSEGYARRFGAERAATISLTVDHDLPAVKSYPTILVRVLDCLVRAARRGGVNRQVDFTIRASRKLNQSKENVEVVLTCKGIPFAARQEELQVLLTEFTSGNYLRSIRDLGLPLCAAMHITRLIGGTAYAQTSPNQPGLVELRFLFEKIEQTARTPIIPNVFYLMTESELLESTIKKFADFYCAKVVRVRSAQDVPKGAALIFDAQTLSNATIEQLKLLPCPEQTTLILSTNEVVTWRELAKLGFLHFATVPLVSTRLLHCVSGSAAYVRPHSDQEASSLQKLRVLVVDDTATARIVLRDYLELEGHGVIEATDGGELVAQIQNGGRFDIIFCDQTMSHMDGATAAKQVRAFEDKLGRHTPIVLMTAYTATDGPSEADRSIFDLMLAKPVQPNQIEEVLQRLVYSKTQTVSVKKPTNIIDLADLRERCAGKTKTMVRVLESFIDGSKSSLNKLKAEDFGQDRIMLARSLHTLKGLLRDAGAKEAAKILEEIEQRAENPAYLVEVDLPLIERAVESACNSAQIAKDELIRAL